jgi:hypothetical protein
VGERLRVLEGGKRKGRAGDEQKAKYFLTERTKSEILREIFEVGYVAGILRSTPRSNPYAVSLS